jgi:hypothetical protein
VKFSFFSLFPGVRKQSLPLEAVCYFGTVDICNVFSINFGAGQVLFIGFDYNTLSQVRVLVCL